MTEYASRHFLEGDQPLRRDLRLLGWQFRSLIQQHAGDAAWQQLYELRQLAERRRQGDGDAETQIADRLAELPTERVAALTRSVGIFFDLANLAEDRHRVRILRQRAESQDLDETVGNAIATIRASTSLEERSALLRELRIEPVFTAHPTEAKRRSVRRLLRRIREDLYSIDDRRLLRAERKTMLDRMRQDMLALWSTDAVSPRKPTVMEELQRTTYVVRTLWEVGPDIVARLRAALGDDERDALPDAPLMFGNWIGGDRDGNPFVTSDVTHETLEYLRGRAIEYHRRSCRTLRRSLTVSIHQCPLPDSLKVAIEQARIRWPRLARHLDPLHPDEWIVQWLTIVDQRLRKSSGLPDTRPHALAYATADELKADVQRVRDALDEAGYTEFIEGELSRWLDRIDMFGLHLLRLDIRVNSTSVREAVHHLLNETDDADDYLGLDEPQRLAALESADDRRAATVPATTLPDAARDVLEVLTLVQRCARAGDIKPFGQFIVSMTHTASDILGVVWLMRVAAHRSGFSEPVPLPVAPLFETVKDLNAAVEITSILLASPMFETHMQQGTRELACMIGYSDSAKDGGYMASNWALYAAQRRLAEHAHANAIPLTVFHGRGGAIGRGGGPAARAILSLPPNAVNSRLRLTEQGEVIAARYDDPQIAQRHLEQLTWATLIQSAPHDDALPSGAEDFAQDIATHSERTYRELIEMDGFEDYLRECTPLSLIEKLPIGSRPSRRSSAARFEDLRAIPFTFAWNQARMPINAFYGLGAAMQAVGPEGQAKAAELYEAWPWFRAVVNNAELALAKCDTRIAYRYACRATDRDAAMAVWARMRDEHDAAREAILHIKKEQAFFSTIPWLHRTIRVRTPYLDILNLAQLELLKRLDAEEGEDARHALDDALRLTVHSIAAGLRTTG